MMTLPAGGAEVFRRIDAKILTVIGLVVTVGMAVLVTFYSEREEQNILAQNKRTLIKVVDSTRQGLKTLMNSGYGDVGPIFSESLSSISDVADIRMMRVDGLEAFVDNKTIREVNRRAGFEQFYEREQELRREVLPFTHAGLQRVLETSDLVEYYDATADGERLYTLLAPVLMEPGCEGCHPAEQSVLGVIKLTTSLRHLDASIVASRLESLLVLVVSVGVIMVVLRTFVRRNVVAPIRAITGALRRASGGDLKQELPLPPHTELEVMASSFNRMTRQLASIYSGLQAERNKLATIILGAKEGMVATDRSGRVVLVNPAAEALLGKGLDRIARDGFTSLFDDSDWMEARMGSLHDGQPVVESIQYRGQILSVQMATIHDESGDTIGSAALLRDITQETELQNRLQHESRTDMLTGLYNRRHFDEQLEAEFNLAQRYDEPLALALLDIDHFKRFNDLHGHDQGDRVLKAVASTMQQTMRKVDICCRYGGEEFVVILPDLDETQAIAQVERLRKAIEALRVDGLTVTASFGVAMLCAPVIDSPQAMVRAADKALYAAKGAGRNRVERAPVS